MSVTTEMTAMEAFIATHNPADKWDTQTQDELIRYFNSCLASSDWKAVEAIVVASRQGEK